MNRLPIEKATKEEIIAALRSTTVYWDELKARLENHLYNSKCSALLAEMHRLNDEADKWRQIPGEPFNHARHRKFLETHTKFQRVNKQLAKLQDS